MRTIFDDASTLYFVTPLEEEHWSEFRDFYTGLKRPAHYVDPKRDYSDEASWQGLLADSKMRGNDMFALWHHGKIIGMTGILYERTDNPASGVAVMTSTQIADDFLGKGLSSFLYDVRLNHLKESGFKGSVETYIEPDNQRSIGAARKNGFEHREDRVTPLYDVYVLRDKAGHFRPQ